MIDALDWVGRRFVRWPVTIILIVVFLLASVSVLPGWMGAGALAVAVGFAVYGWGYARGRASVRDS